jgi:hypothetical protein
MWLSLFKGFQICKHCKSSFHVQVYYVTFEVSLVFYNDGNDLPDYTTSYPITQNDIHTIQISYFEKCQSLKMGRTGHRANGRRVRLHITFTYTLTSWHSQQVINLWVLPQSNISFTKCRGYGSRIQITTKLCSTCCIIKFPAVTLLF